MTCRILTVWAIVATVLTPWAADVGAAQEGGASTAGEFLAGMRTYEAVGCSGCHGIGGQGGLGPMTGSRIANVPADAIIAFIRQPRAPMPPYSARVLPDARVREIATYLNALPTPQPSERIKLLPPEKVTGTAPPSPLRKRSSSFSRSSESQL